MTTLKTAGIRATGHAIPDTRLTAHDVRNAWGSFTAKGVERMAVPAFDEDATTLAVDAVHRALAAWGGDPRDLTLVAFATSGPDAGAATVAEALGAPRARPLDITGRPVSGLAALQTAFDSVNAGNGPALVVAADVPRGAPGTPEEHGAGAGAAAFVVTPDGAVRLDAAATVTYDAPGERRIDENGYVRESGLDLGTRDRLRDVLADLGAADVAFTVAPPRTPAPGDVDVPDFRRHVGDAGAAHPLLRLVHALGQVAPKRQGVVAHRGGGAAVALRFDVRARPAGDLDVATPAQGGRDVPYVHALRARGHFLQDLDLSDAPMGAHVPLTDYATTLGARYRLEAQRCTGCDRLQLPPKPRCGACAGAELRPERLSGRGRVYACTTIGAGGAPSEFAAQQAMGGAYPVAVVELEEGLRVSVQLTGPPTERVRIGAPVRAVFRRLYRQQGVVRYGLKFAVEDDGTA